MSSRRLSPWQRLTPPQQRALRALAAMERASRGKPGADPWFGPSPRAPKQTLEALHTRGYLHRRTTPFVATPRYPYEYRLTPATRSIIREAPR
jgi:hypothetical protein